MAGIVCAIRGGPGSKETIQASIDLAKRLQQPLHFLYVVNLEFLQRTESSRVRIVTNELENMGDFILLSARARAEDQGLDAQGTVRHGNVADEIIGLAVELDASHIVLGRPAGDQEENVFTEDRLQAFSDRIQSESGAQVIIARPKAPSG